VLKPIQRVAAVSGEAGSVIERLAHDPWGTRVRQQITNFRVFR
jgi:hypothetical protein